MGAIERLVRIPSPGIRERALRLGASLLPEARLIEHVRNDADATLRNAGLEMLKLRGAHSFPLAMRLLNDPDEDVALQAVLILDHLRDARARTRCAPCSRAPISTSPKRPSSPSAGSATRARCPTCCPSSTAIPGCRWRRDAALGDLRSPRGARPDPPLRRLDAELDRGRGGGAIGGLAAYRALAEHWQRHGAQLDADSVLGLLARMSSRVCRAHRPITPVCSRAWGAGSPTRFRKVPLQRPAVASFSVPARATDRRSTRWPPWPVPAGSTVPTRSMRPAFWPTACRRP